MSASRQLKRMCKLGAECPHQDVDAHIAALRHDDLSARPRAPRSHARAVDLLGGRMWITKALPEPLATFTAADYIPNCPFTGEPGAWGCSESQGGLGLFTGLVVCVRAADFYFLTPMGTLDALRVAIESSDDETVLSGWVDALETMQKLHKICMMHDLRFGHKYYADMQDVCMFPFLCYAPTLPATTCSDARVHARPASSSAATELWRVVGLAGPDESPEDVSVRVWPNGWAVTDDSLATEVLAEMNANAGGWPLPVMGNTLCPGSFYQSRCDSQEVAETLKQQVWRSPDLHAFYNDQCRSWGVVYDCMMCSYVRSPAPAFILGRSSAAAPWLTGFMGGAKEG